LTRGGLTPLAHRRVAQPVIAAEECGASAVQFTCSSVSPCVDVARVMVSIPVLKVDEPMVEQALSRGTRIGVVATAPTALGPTTDSLRARDQEKRVQVEPILCEDAYAALLCGDLGTHDRIVRGALKSLLPRCDVVVLAQASMASVTGPVPAEEQGVPILSSPRLAMERVRGILAALNA
jgi:Asp/Glu/hydantoin racemase